MAIEKVTITKVYASDKSKDGKPFINRFNKKPQVRVGIMVDKHENEWWSNFCDPDSKEAQVKEGDEMNLVLWETETGFKNWKLPSKTDLLEARVDALEFAVRKYMSQNVTSAGTRVPDFTPNTPEQAKEFGKKMVEYEDDGLDQIKPEDIPF
jgi:hypothetical protein